MRLAMVWGIVGTTVLAGSWPSASIYASAQTPMYTVFAAQPAEGHGRQETRVSLDLKAVTVQDALDQIAAKARLALMWDHAKIPLNQKITIALKDATVPEALTAVLRGTGAEGRLSSDGQTILVVRAKVSGRVWQGGVIAGRVTDSASGQGLSGASVRVAGIKGVSAVTSDSGNFTLRDVPPGDQVVTVRLFGYKPAERSVTVVDSQRTMVRIVMASVPTVLSGVVTTATGIQRRIEVGNDITSLNVDSIMRIAPIQSVTDLLETRVPGLTVLHSSGVPGDPSRLRLRGPGSVQLNNDPIVIVDGIRVYASQSDPRNQNLAPAGPNVPAHYNAPSPLDQIDPNSIETIEVLKGPSASATYGSDAAAGVIVITTKHGRAGPARWSLGLGAGVNWIPGPWPANDFKFGLNVFSGYGLCFWYEVSCHVDTVVTFQALNDSRYTVFSHGSDQQATLTVSGGSQSLLYSLMGTGTGDLGNLKLPGSEQVRYDSLYGQTYGKIPSYLVRPDHYTTSGVNGSMTANVSRTFQVAGQSALFNSSQQRSPLEGAISQLEGAYINPSSGAYLANGTTYQAGEPLITGEYQRVTSDQVTMTNGLSLSWQPAVWLPITATAGVNTIQRHDVTYTPFGINNDGSDTTGEYGLGHGSSEDQTVTLGTTIPVFRQRMTLAVGGNLYTGSTEDYTVATDELSPGVTVPTTFTYSDCSIGNTCNSPTYQSTSQQSTYGWYLQPTLHVLPNLFASPGFRLDGGSGGSHSSGSVGGLSAFPKLDLSYVAVDRQGGRPLWGVVSLLRPRLAVGVAGTQPGPADKLRLYNVGQYTLTVPGQGTLNIPGTGGYCTTTVSIGGPTPVPAVCLDYLGNTDLRPERSTEVEGGFDATLWRNRLSVTYTQYNKTRHDAIMAVPIAPSVFGDNVQIQKNIGEVRNTGTEITVNAQLLQSRAFGWNVGANLSNDNNLVVRLNPGQSPIIMNTYSTLNTQIQDRIEAGYPLFADFTRPIIGAADANHDGVIEPNEIVYGDSMVYLGQPNPKYQFNLTSDLALLDGRLTIHAGFAYQNGMTQVNAGACTSGLLPLVLNQPNVSLSTQTAVVAADCDGYARSSNPVSSAVGLAQIVNTFRFNELSVNYIVPTSISHWFRAPRMTVAVQGSNLALHTNYRGVDPDVNALSTVSAGDETVDGGQIPEPRTWWLRFTVGN